MPTVFVGNHRLDLTPDMVFGEGGEAIVFDIRKLIKGVALKLFRLPSDPLYDGDTPQAHYNREGARERLVMLPEKLAVFPKLPAEVIAPRDIVTGMSKEFCGYTMELIENADSIKEFSSRKFRANGPDNNGVRDLFLELATLVERIHKAKVVIGDFNNYNVLVKKGKPYYIDADSMQYDKFMCKTFTPLFVDPLICDPNSQALSQITPHSADTDWYAFALMLFHSLLYVHPYLGVHAPKDMKKKVPEAIRPLKRISVFDPDVIYPKVATHYKCLPDDLLDYYHKMIENDRRGVFPRALLENLRWTKCKCGAEHARRFCPECAHKAPTAMVKVTIKGNVTMTSIFRTGGRILDVRVYGNDICYAYVEDGILYRENKRAIAKMPTIDDTYFRVQGSNTMVVKSYDLKVLDLDGQTIASQATDTYRGRYPIFSCNRSYYFWSKQGDIYRNDQFGDKLIGRTLKGQTRFSVSEDIGFGFSKAGKTQMALLFDPKIRGLREFELPKKIDGDILDSRCYFSKDRVWFLVTSRKGGSTINDCFAIDFRGNVTASATAQEHDGSWLGHICGKTAVTTGKEPTLKHNIFSTTDNGIVHLVEDNGEIVQVADYPGTSSFVDTATESIFLLPKEGILVVSDQTISLLKIN